MAIRYTVLWRDDVQNDLARLWLDSSTRQQIAAAADIIDAELSSDAHLKGQAIQEDAKSLTCSPLLILAQRMIPWCWHESAVFRAPVGRPGPIDSAKVYNSPFPNRRR